MDIGDPDDFDGAATPDTVDIVIVDAGHADYNAADQTVAGTGADLFMEDFSREAILISQFDTRARALVSNTAPLRLWQSEVRAAQEEIASFGTIAVEAGETGTDDWWRAPVDGLSQTTGIPALRGGGRGFALQRGGVWRLADGGSFLDPSGERIAMDVVAAPGDTTNFLRVVLSRGLPAGSEANYKLLLRSERTGTVSLVHMDRSRSVERLPAFTVYHFGRPIGMSASDVTGGWSVSMWDSTLAGYTTGPAASPPVHSIPFTYPTEYQISIIALWNGASRDWPARRTPNLQLKLAGPVALPDTALASYTLFVRAPSDPETVFTFPLASPERTAINTAGDLSYFWSVSDSLRDSFRNLKRLYAGQAFIATIQDTLHPDSRTSDRQPGRDDRPAGSDHRRRGHRRRDHVLRVAADLHHGGGGAAQRGARSRPRLHRPLAARHARTAERRPRGEGHHAIRGRRRRLGYALHPRAAGRGGGDAGARRG